MTPSTNKVPRAVVYPICNGNYTDSSIPLLMSMRSVEKNLADDIPVFVISEKVPLYLSDDVTYVKCDGYIDALRKATEVADEILWMNDDIYLLTPTCWEDLRVWYASERQASAEDAAQLRGSDSKWRSRKGKVFEKLLARGLTTFNYSMHTPYLYESSALAKVLLEFDFGYKTAIETAYGNTVGVKRRSVNTKLSRHHAGFLPIDVTRYTILNHDDKGLTDHMTGFLLGMFPKPSKFEDHGRVDLSKLLMNEIK